MTEATSPFATLRTNPGAVLVASFDLLTRASRDVRRGSLYVGLIVLGTIGPAVLLSWGFEVAAEGLAVTDLTTFDSGPLDASVFVAESLSVLGAVVAFVESRAIAIALLGARLEGRAFGVREALQRSRAVFWRVLAGIALINVPLVIAQLLVSGWLARILHGPWEGTVLTVAILGAVIASPFAYVLTGIVLGDVGPVEAARRSVALFSARRRTAVVVSVFALAAQLLTLFGASAGLEIVGRVFESLAIGASGDVGVAIVTVVIVAMVFALGSLLFTVAAIAAAPQVVAFLALTHVSPGLDTGTTGTMGDAASSGARRRGFRWLTIPMAGAMVLGGLATVVGLASLNT